MVSDKTEKVGFEPTVPFGITGFQDQLLKPLGHLSESSVLNSAYMILAKYFSNVNRFLTFFSFSGNSAAFHALPYSFSSVHRPNWP